MSIKRLSGAGLTTPKSNKLWDQTTFQSGMFSIATIVAGADADYFDFTNIPQTYQHLQLRVTGAGAYNPGGSGYIESWIGLNVTGGTAPTTGYTHRMWGDGASVTSNSSAQTTLLSTPWIPYGLNNAYVGSYIIDIIDYANLTKNKVIRSMGGYDANGSGMASFHSGYENITSAISTIRVSTNSGAFKAGAICALYGIKAA